MKKIFALLCGVIIVLLATLVSAITRDPYLFTGSMNGLLYPHAYSCHSRNKSHKH